MPAAGVQRARRRPDSAGREEGRRGGRQASSSRAAGRRVPPAGDHGARQRRSPGRFRQEQVQQARRVGQQRRNHGGDYGGWRRGSRQGKNEFRQGPGRDCRMAQAADHAEHSAGRRMPQNQLPRHQERHRGAAPTPPILLRWKDRQCHVSVWAAQVFQRRGAPAGAERHRHADQATAGRAVGAVRGGLEARRRRAGAPRVAGRPGVRGVPGVQGARVRLHEDPREGERRAAGQLRPPGLRRDRDELQHGQPDGRGRRQRLRRRGSRRAGRRDRRLLRPHGDSIFCVKILESTTTPRRKESNVYCYRCILL